MRRTVALAALAAACAAAPPPAEPAPTPPPPAPAPAPSASAPVAPSARALPAEPPAAPATKKPAGPFNVVLLLVDSLRADMPWAGYPREIAPNLTALEKTCASYTRGYSTSSYTAKSVAAALSGKYPSTLKRSGYFFTKYPESNLFFPELLGAAGVHTLATHGHMYMKKGHNGMDQGFSDWRIVDGLSFDAQTDNHVTSDKMTPLAIAQLDAMPKGKPFFMYLHYMDPHDVYHQHKDSPVFGKKTRDRYDSEVFYTDLWIGKLLDHMKKQPWWDKTVVIVSADHGEAFGEHKLYRHAFELWEMLVRVPLMFCGPGITARRIDTPRSSIDFAPTVLELLGVKAEHDFVGQSLVAELGGASAPERPVLLDLPADSNNPERRALISGDYKLLVFGSDWRFDLYDLKNDPGETKDLAKTQPEKLAEMKALYQKVWAPLPKVKPFGGNKLEGGGVASGPAN
ncbi:MAG: sulfatase [Myxococcales bacterium]|nr:sulfatase [Myxococcales bacterium]